MHSATIITRGIVFHQYNIMNADEMVMSIRADAKEIEGVVKLFNSMENWAVQSLAAFPYAVVQGETSAQLCGPHFTTNQWVSLMEGPASVLESVLSGLLQSFSLIRVHPNARPPALDAPKSRAVSI